MELPSKFLIAILFLIKIQESESSCSDKKDCKSCANYNNWLGSCNWCTLTKTCHSSWSAYNECGDKHNVDKESNCLIEDKYEYNATEAYKLTLFSALPYSKEPEKCLKAIFPGNTYTMESVLFQQCDDFSFDYDHNCTAIVAYSHVNKEVIIAFRGTNDLTQLLDQFIATLTEKTVKSPIGGKVQSYFKNIYTKFYDSVKNLTQKLRTSYPNYKVKLTGHSLGGTTASITSAKLIQDKILKPSDVSLYTLGMPRVGDKDYAHLHDKLVPDSWRVVREGDQVVDLPKCFVSCLFSSNGPFHHGNKVIYTDTVMTKNSTYAVCRGNDDDLEDCKKVTPSLIRKKRFIYETIEKHTHYFGIRMGTYCNDVLKQTKKSTQ